MTTTKTKPGGHSESIPQDDNRERFRAIAQRHRSGRIQLGSSAAKLTHAVRTNDESMTSVAGRNYLRS